MKSIKLKLFIKVFSILVILGVILPYIIKLTVGKLDLLNKQVPSGNSILVMKEEVENDSYSAVFFKMLQKFIQNY